ncbi:hypothetical protein SAMN04487765_0931 [Tenacibaculum sp. MAR_2010_89]|uniref:hypothetical protein n=1 Tax=Tenacibaculum sp. MAR_2010_89 TaxID=1250198 RepID=UPI0008992925|nr:hypothetical protein [Tenacibaculum sp. MAR_2010_89]SED96113.1 hypothetical protein SAMN04487765_0931 [Tenacibaculum sp. MAR_2010_89]
MFKIYRDNVKLGGHNNLVFEIFKSGFKQVVDTYFFAIDKKFNPNDESLRKANLNIINLLENWLIELDKGRKEIFLPFDFSDQYIGCIKVVIKEPNNLLCISYGATTEYSAISLKPSGYPENFNLSENDFIEMDSNVLEISHSDFITIIKSCIIEFKSESNNIEWLN